MIASLGGLTAACDKGAPPPAASAVAPEEASGTNDPTSPLNFQGTPVSTLYPDHYPYRGGTLDKVTFRLLD